MGEEDSSCLKILLSRWVAPAAIGGCPLSKLCKQEDVMHVCPFRAPRPPFVSPGSVSEDIILSDLPLHEFLLPH